MNEFIARWSKNSVVPGLPRWVIPIVVLSLLAYLLRSIRYRPENFTVFLFDYEYEFIRRGLLGAVVNLIPVQVEEYFVFWTLYGAASVTLFFLALMLISKSLICKNDEATISVMLLCLFVFMSPIFLKNSYWDFGRFDQLGFLCLLIFALASPPAQKVLVVVLPPILILCHEAQVILTIAPMIAIFLIGALHEKSLLQLRTLVPLILSIAGSLAMTAYFLIHGIPHVEYDVLKQYIESKSEYHSKGRTFLLYDNLSENMAIGMGKGREWRQLGASPLYVLTIVLHWPVIGVLFRAYKESSSSPQRLACGLIGLTVVAQCAVFFLSIDYSRHIANIFFSFVVMLYFLIHRFDLEELVAAHAKQYRTIIIALLFVSLPIHRFGIVAP